MRLPPDQPWYVGLWHCAFELGDMLAGIVRMPPRYALHFSLQVSFRKAPWGLSAEPGESQSAFWQRCDQLTYETVVMQFGPNFGELVWPLQYFAVEGMRPQLTAMLRKWPMERVRRYGKFEPTFRGPSITIKEIKI